MKCRHETPCSKRCLLGTGELKPCRGYDKCKEFQPNYTTNADRIRTMSDEELAEFRAGSHCPPSRRFPDCATIWPCSKCWREYLRQPVKDGETE